MTDKLHLRLFGGLFVEIEGQSLTGIKTQKEALLLAYLAIAQRPFTRETLANLLWDDRDQSLAMSNLRTLLSRLRKTVGAYVQIDRQSVAIVSDKVWVDVLEFDTHLTTANANESEDNAIPELETAVSLVVGGFLAGVSIVDSAGLENWQRQTNEQLCDKLIAARQQLATYYFYSRKYTKGIEHARDLVRLDPIREQAHQLLMRLLARDGQLNAALQQYQNCATELANELGVQPSVETQALHGRLQTAKTSPAHKLPLLETSFIGREDELRQIEQRLDAENGRLLTIVGMGGVGKTRLALQVANVRRGDYLHGIYFVSLAGVQTAVELPTFIGQTIGLSFDNQSIAQQLFQYLQNKELLLLLDNIEHLLTDPGTVSFIQQMRQQATYLTLMVTSRQPLRLRSEWLLRLEGLPYSQLNQQADEYTEAVHLFRQRARQQGFNLNNEMTMDVNQICQLVEGLPLAIELVTATLDLYSLAEISRNIQHHMKTLAVAFHDMPTRHHSIHAVFEYSWQLLSAEEQKLLGQLSVFRGQFDQTAVTQITGARPIVLQNLVNKSLLRQEANGRYELHELLRQFANEKLQIVSELAQQTAYQHATYYLQDTATYYRALNGIHLQETLNHLQLQWQNIMVGWWLLVQNQSDISLLAMALPTLKRYYNQHRYLEQGAIFFEETVVGLQSWQAAINDEITGFDVSTVLLHSLNFQIQFLIDLADFESVTDLMQQSRHLTQICNSPTFTAESLLLEGSFYGMQGYYDQASTFYKQAIALLDKIDAPDLLVEGLYWQGFLDFMQGNHATSEMYYRQALEIEKAEENLTGMGRLYKGLGDLYGRIGRWEQAEQALQKVYELANLQGNNNKVMATLANLGRFYSLQGFYEKAVNCFLERLPWAYDTKLSSVAETYDNLGLDYFHLGQYDQAQTAYAQSLEAARLTNARNLACTTLMNWGLLYHRQGVWETAVSHCQQAIEIAHEMNVLYLVGYAQTTAGHALVTLGMWDEAQEAYEEALQIRLSMEDTPLILETTAGLASLAQVKGDTVQAQKLALEIAENLSDVVGAEEPLWVYWICYEVLRETTLAEQILKDAYALLQEQATKIENPAFKQSFLYTIPYHRKIMEAVA